MPKVSRRPVTDEAIIINNFWRAATLLGNKEEVRDFLKALLTTTEMLMVAKRLEVSRMLIKDCGYVEIQQRLKVSNSAINHVKRSLEKGSYFGIIKPLQRLEDKDAKLRKNQTSKLERNRVNLFKTTLSQEILKVVVVQAVKQYKKWSKFESAKY